MRVNLPVPLGEQLAEGTTLDSQRICPEPKARYQSGSRYGGLRRSIDSLYGSDGDRLHRKAVSCLWGPTCQLERSLPNKHMHLLFLLSSSEDMLKKETVRE